MSFSKNTTHEVNAHAIEDKSTDINDAQLREAALRATENEHASGTWLALCRHYKAALWSLALSTCVVMEGYDTMLVGNLIAQPSFKHHYGTPSSKGSYQIPPSWQSGLTTGSTCGQLIGLLIGGYASERIGFRKCIMMALVSTMGFVFIQVFAPSLGVLETGQVLFGIPLGMLQTTPVVYAMEVTPLVLRGYLTTYVNFCWSIGHLLGAGILRSSLQIEGPWSYRMPFTLQWFWPIILIPVVFLAPESPWRLVRQGQLEASKAQQRRLLSSSHPNPEEYVDEQTALMVVTIEYERSIQAETSFVTCFKKTDLKRTLIVIGIYVAQTLSGNPLRSYSTYFLNQAGLPSTQAFNMTIVNYALAFIGGFVSWLLLPFIGRRTIYVWSMALMLVLMIVIGALGIPSITPEHAMYAWAIGAILIVSSFVYNATIGPLTNTLCVEIPSTVLRSKSIALARWFYAVSGIVAGVITPYQLSPDAWNWGAKTGFFWAGSTALCFVCAYFFVPETKGKTIAEVDYLFENKISARKSACVFATTFDAV